ncbi:class I SAM-dependent methyltransferase [Streptococcus australis]|uniref:class I SAM-dependent methyltransferase n=1 Tax=Streptococcus TaxID=1301 RepID=UPI0003B936F0|nr:MULTISPECIES: class I SAM-dependent methyltransferase [Streptococcus]AGY37434.1 DNA methyltransferase [Streptococcus ilei]MCG5642689.1 class I SAM-dependent methyltransferase [Streptococcus sp. DFI.7.26]MDB8644914.1 class I SAM-dependent methyltransferase [Streptococcus australis]
MNFEKIEKAYGYLLENTQTIQNDLQTNFYDALVEQNAIYLDGQTELTLVKENNQRLKDLNLNKEEWRRSFQYLLMKAAQTEPLQANHQFTPDGIGFLLVFLVDQLASSDQVDVLEMGSGTGNLAQTLMNNCQRSLDYLGLEIDDLLIDLAASMAEVMKADVNFAQGDAIRPQVLKESDVIISDLPVGYYPDDAIASRYQVASPQGHTYAHHLLIEQSLKYLKPGGVAIFLAPNDLLTSEQSPLLKQWMQDHAQVLAMVTLPENLFRSANLAKTIFVFRKQEEAVVQPFVYPLTDLQDQEDLMKFRESFQNWNKESEI